MTTYISIEFPNALGSADFKYTRVSGHMFDIILKVYQKQARKEEEKERGRGKKGESEGTKEEDRKKTGGKMKKEEE